MNLIERRSHAVKSLNELLVASGLVLVDSFDDITSNLLLTLYTRLQLYRPLAYDEHRARTSTGKGDFCLLLRLMSDDVKCLDLSAFDVNQLYARDRTQLLSFVELFICFGRLLSMGRMLRHGSCEKSCTIAVDDGEPRTSELEDDTRPSPPEQGTGAEELFEDRAQTIFTNPRLGHLISPPRHGHLDVQPAQARARLRRAARKRMRASIMDKVPNLNQSLLYERIRRPRRCERHLNMPSDFLSTPLSHTTSHVVIEDTITADAPKQGATAEDEGVPSFFSEASTEPASQGLGLDSPYTKYLKARRELVLDGIGHKLSPLRGTPIKMNKVARGRRNRCLFIQGSAPVTKTQLPIRTTTFRHQLANSRILSESIASSSNSDQSFYRE